jgi:hypothetical protein
LRLLRDARCFFRSAPAARVRENPYERSKGGERPGSSVPARRPWGTGSAGGAEGFGRRPEKTMAEEADARASPWLRHATQPWLACGPMDFAKLAADAENPSAGSG